MRENSTNFQEITRMGRLGTFFDGRTGKINVRNLEIAIFAKICSSADQQNPDYYIRQR